jgi:gluconokinase
MSKAPRYRPQLIVLMGISGVGKTTIGHVLAERLGWRFFDADDFHPDANVAKMQRGTPLTDEDRQEWLDRLSLLIGSCVAPGEPAVLACSALKRSYRAKLRRGHEGVIFVYLKAPREVVEARLGDRKDHFFNPDLLESQIAALEEPVDAVIVDAAASVEEIVDEIEDALG